MCEGRGDVKNVLWWLLVAVNALRLWIVLHVACNIDKVPQAWTF